jgi:exodeoxyribonuclease VII small subunit
MSTDDTAPPHSFEAALARLNGIVARMEGGAPELDESLALFEEGVRLLRYAEEVLDTAELRISRLEEDGAGGSAPEELPPEP